MSEHFDLVVIGAGPAGEAGAVRAASAGKRVCLVERAPKPGGASVNAGTIPSKTLRESALVLAGLRQRGLYGVEFHVRGDVTLADFMRRERPVVEASWHRIEENLARHGVATLQGTARFADPRTLEVTRHGQEPRLITADVYLLATGSHPWQPAHLPVDGSVLLDTDDLLRLERIPARLVVLGDDAVGCEYACTFAALGAKVTIVSPADRLLAAFDVDVSDTLRREFTRRLGIHAIAGLDATHVEARDGLGHVTLADGTVLVAEAVLCGGARQGTTQELGLGHAGVAVDERGFVQVDDKYRSSITHIRAAGDVIGRPASSAAAIEQARIAVSHAFDLPYPQDVSGLVPTVVWTIPEVASVGLIEHDARARGLAHDTRRASFRANTRALILGETEGFVKLVVAPGDRRLLGATIVGDGASELIHIASSVIAFGGTLDYFAQASFASPSLAEAFRETTDDRR